MARHENLRVKKVSLIKIDKRYGNDVLVVWSHEDHRWVTRRGRASILQTDLEMKTCRWVSLHGLWWGMTKQEEDQSRMITASRNPQIHRVSVARFRHNRFQNHQEIFQMFDRGETREGVQETKPSVKTRILEVLFIKEVHNRWIKSDR